MAQRYGSSNLHQRDSRSALFEGYTGGSSSNHHNDAASRRQFTPSPSIGGGYGYSGGGGGGPMSGGSHLGPPGGGMGGYRSATPNRRGQYSDAVLNELESQNDAQVEGILGKVKILKDMTVAIGDEIRDSSAFADKLNDSFDTTKIRLNRTMNRMMIMAEKTGVSWKAWLFFFAAVILIFMYVWLF